MTPYHSIRKAFLLGLFTVSFSAGAFATKDTDISDRLLQTFRQTFPDAQQVVWAEQDGIYAVDFRQRDILTNVLYDKDGNLLHSLRYYSGRNLPVTILSRLQKRFPGKTIFGVIEIASETSVEYNIRLEDDHNWITVSSDIEGDLEVIEKYKKN